MLLRSEEGRSKYSFFIGFFWPFLFETCYCAGEDEGASTSFSKPEWETALSLPDDHVAPECLRSHIREQLRFLFNIGRKTTLSDRLFENFIEPLYLNDANIRFARALLSRVEALQLEHYNKGDHVFFKFSTRGEKERLYSVIWEYANPRNKLFFFFFLFEKILHFLF